MTKELLCILPKTKQGLAWCASCPENSDQGCKCSARRKVLMGRRGLKTQAQLKEYLEGLEATDES